MAGAEVNNVLRFPWGVSDVLSHFNVCLTLTERNIITLFGLLVHPKRSWTITRVTLLLDQRQLLTPLGEGGYSVGSRTETHETHVNRDLGA